VGSDKQRGKKKPSTENRKSGGENRRVSALGNIRRTWEVVPLGGSLKSTLVGSAKASMGTEKKTNRLGVKEEKPAGPGRRRGKSRGGKPIVKKGKKLKKNCARKKELIEPARTAGREVRSTITRKTRDGVGKNGWGWLTEKKSKSKNERPKDSNYGRGTGSA